jgi:hypothetical protein
MELFSGLCQEGSHLVSHPVVREERNGKRIRLIRENERRKCLIDADFFSQKKHK